MPTMYDFAGGEEGPHELEGHFYSLVLADDLLKPLFGNGQPQHVDHLTAFTAESFGGPHRITEQLGFAHLIDVYRGLRISEPQGQRFVDLYLQALDEVGLGADPDFREAVRSHTEFGSRVAMQNSNAVSEDEIHPLREVPIWRWAKD